jgi:hypothetical protein
MARQVQSDLDIQGALLLDGDPGAADQIPLSQGASQPAAWGNLGDRAVLSLTAGLTGADRVTKIVSLTQEEYDTRAILADDATTLFIVGDNAVTSGVSVDDAASLAACLAIALG